jgi:hypothetical protein
MAIIAGSFLAIAGIGAWCGSAPLSGAVDWLAKGLIQSTYAALLALSAWLAVRLWRSFSYLLLLGIAILGVAVWTAAMGIQDYRLRREANETISTFRYEPLNALGLVGIIERNPYVEAYMVMRDAHWDLQDRLNKRIDRYRVEYENYSGKDSFLAVSRLRSRFELWQTFYQIRDLELMLDAMETEALDTSDLLWTVNLLEVDSGTREAYAQDFMKSVSAAKLWQTEFVAREKRTLRRIRNSLTVVIDAKGRYRFAEGRIVFDDPEDAASFAGKESPDG